MSRGAQILLMTLLLVSIKCVAVASRPVVEQPSPSADQQQLQAQAQRLQLIMVRLRNVKNVYMT